MMEEKDYPYIDRLAYYLYDKHMDYIRAKEQMTLCYFVKVKHIKEINKFYKIAEREIKIKKIMLNK
ncbi:MAG: hypothetical protein ACOCVF_02610 [bacterium]